MVYAVWCMTLVQAQIPEVEYRLLRQRASEEGASMKEIMRRALHAYLADDRVDPNDPIFHIFPLGKSGRKGHRTSERHDELLYPVGRR